MKKGDFVRAWDGERPGSKKDYAYGVYYVFDEGSELHYLWNYGKPNYFQHAEPATTQPEWAEPCRRVIADRAKLCRVLLDMGYEPGPVGFYKHLNTNFLHEMFSLCGEPVRKTSRSDNYYLKDYTILPEWTEEY